MLIKKTLHMLDGSGCRCQLEEPAHVCFLSSILIKVQREGDFVFCFKLTENDLRNAIKNDEDRKREREETDKRIQPHISPPRDKKLLEGDEKEKALL